MLYKHPIPTLVKYFNNLRAPKIDTPEETREDSKELQLADRSCLYSVQ